MATESPMLRDSNCVAVANYYNPTVALAGPNSSGQFLAVKLATSASRTVTLASTGGEAIYGILQNTPKLGEPAEVAMLGVTKAVAGAAIATAGLELMTDSSARLVTATSTNHSVAVALEPAAAAGQLISVALIPLGRASNA